MTIELTTLIGLTILSFCLGGGIMHLLKQRKINKLKEELFAYKRSVSGLWELNEERVRKTKKKIEDFRRDMESDKPSRSILSDSNNSDLDQPTTGSSVSYLSNQR